MVQREEIITHAKEKYKTDPYHPWEQYPTNIVLRHKKSGKWYGLILDVEKAKLGLDGEGLMDVLNLKCDPEFASILKTQEGILPGYHMNKKHWITIVLDEGSRTLEDIEGLIQMSYDLTR